MKKWLARMLVIVMLINTIGTDVLPVMASELQTEHTQELETTSESTEESVKVSSFLGFDWEQEEPFKTLTLTESEREKVSDLLPKDMEANPDDGNNTISIPVTWECKDDVLDNAKTEFLFTMSLAEGYEFSEDVTKGLEDGAYRLPSVLVVFEEVKEESVVEEQEETKEEETKEEATEESTECAVIVDFVNFEETGIDAFATLNVKQNEKDTIETQLAEKYGTLTVKLSDGSTVELDAEWISAEDVSSSDKSLFVFELKLPEGYELSEELQSACEAEEAILPFINVSILKPMMAVQPRAGSLVRHTAVRDKDNKDKLILYAYITGNSQTPQAYFGAYGSSKTLTTMTATNETVNGQTYNYYCKITIPTGVMSQSGGYAYNIRVDGTNQGRHDVIAAQCKIGNTYYNSIEDAVKAISDSTTTNSATIEVLHKDCWEFGFSLISAGKSITIKPSDSTVYSISETLNGTTTSYSVRVRNDGESITVKTYNTSGYYAAGEPNNPYPQFIRVRGGSVTVQGNGNSRLIFDGSGFKDLISGYPCTAIWADTGDNSSGSTVTVNTGVDICNFSAKGGESGTGIMGVFWGDRVQAKNTVTININGDVTIHDNEEFGVSSEGILNITADSSGELKVYNHGSHGIMQYANHATSRATVKGGQYYNNLNGFGFGSGNSISGKDHEIDLMGIEAFNNTNNGVYVNTTSTELWNLTMGKNGSDVNNVYGNGQYGININKAKYVTITATNSYNNNVGGIRNRDSDFFLSASNVNTNGTVGIHNEGIFQVSGSSQIAQNGGTTRGKGGGVYNSGTFTLTSGTIEQNKANYGGGIYNEGYTYINGGSIINNNALSSGGGIYNKPLIYEITGAFAVYFEEDKSLRFYNIDDNVETLKPGDTWDGRVITAIYPDIELLEGLEMNQGGVPWSTDYQTVIEKVIVVNTITPKDTGYWFLNMRNCSYFDVAKLDMSEVRHAAGMFSSAGFSSEITSFEILGLEDWDVGNVTNMREMFANMARHISYGPIDLSHWNVQNVSEHTSFDASVTTQIIAPTFPDFAEGTEASAASVMSLSLNDVEENGAESTASTFAVERSATTYASSGELLGGELYITAGTISGNTANGRALMWDSNGMEKRFPLGNGIYQSGEMYVSADASIASSDEVFLTSTKYITVIGALNKDYVAKVTPFPYFAGRTVVRTAYPEDGITLASVVLSKFALTGYETYFLKNGDFYDDSLGVLDTDIVLSRKYTVTYSASSDTTNVPSAGTKNWNEPYTVSSQVPQRSGCAFYRWSPNFSGSYYYPGSRVSADINRDIELYANWNYLRTTVYKPNGGTGNDVTQTWTQGQSVYTKAYDTFSRNAYRFTGWNTKADGSGADYDYSTSYSGLPSTLYAQWEPINYRITYNENGGSSVSDLAYNITTSVTLAGAPTRTGYNFSGWKLGTAVGNWSATTYSASQNIGTGKYGSITLVAQWTPKSYVVTYKANGGTGSDRTQNIQQGSNTSWTTYTNTFTRTGYTFKEWNTKADGSGTTYGQNAAQTTFAYLTLYAIWTPASNSYKVQHWQQKVGGGSAQNSTNFTLISADTQTLTANTGASVTPAVKSYTGFTSPSKQTVTVAADGSTEVNYYYTRNSYTVTLTKGTGIASVTGAGTYQYGASVTINATASTGYTWKNWTGYNTQTTKEYTFTMPASNVTYTANATANTYKITYDEAGGTAVSDLSYNITTDVTLATTSKTGYIFAGWKLSTAAGNWTTGTYTGGQNVGTGKYGDITLVAQWTPKTIKVTLNNQGATTAGTPAYWYQYKTTRVVNGETIYYYLDANCSDAGAMKNYTITKPEKTGYTFGGYFTGENGTGTQYVNANGQCINNLYSVVANDITLYAKWTPKTIKVTLDNQSATTAGTPAYWYQFNTTRVVNGETIYYYLDANCSDAGAMKKYTITKPEKTGYTFGGYYTGKNGTGTQYVNASGQCINNLYRAVASDITLYAKWTPAGNSYKVQHWQQNLGGGSAQNATNFTLISADTQTISANTGASVTPAVKSYTGFTAPSTQTVTVAADGSTVVNYYYTRNSYTVTLTKGIGIDSVTGAGTYQYGASVTITATLLAGYEWVNWTGESTKTTLTYTFTMPAKNVSYTANGKLITYTITYNLDGGSLPSGKTNPTSYNVTTATFTLNNPTKTGHSFAGWTGTGLSGATQTVSVEKGSTGDRSYTATWTPNTYTIKYDANGGTGTMDSHTINYGNTVKIKDNTFTAPRGYKFAGWTTNSNGTPDGHGWFNASTLAGWTGTWSYVDGQYGIGKEEAKTLKLYAMWTPQTFTIEYKANGGSGTMASHSVSFGSSIKIKDNEFTRTGYSFAGWTTNSDGSADGHGWSTSTHAGWSGTWNYVNGQYGIADNKLVLYARWTPITYTITYNLDGGALPSGKTNPTSYNVTTETFPLNNPTKTGHTFLGWTGSNGTTAQTSVSVVKGSTGNKTFTANWKVNSYTATFDANGGTTANPQTITKNYGVALGTLPTTSRTGYTFDGWYTAASGGTKISSSTTMPASNVTYYAHWTPNTYTVAFNGNGHTSGSMSNQSFTYDVAQNLTANAFKRAYTVTYNYNGNGTANSTANANATFNGWATSASGAKVYNDKQSVKNLATSGTYTLYANWTLASVTLPTPTRTGYTFTGWYTAATGGTKVGAGGASYTPTANVTLYAQWVEAGVNYTVNHYKMDLTGKYPTTPTETETLSAKTGTVLTLANLKKTYTGFTYKEGKVGGTVVTTTTVNADGSTVINLYYTRNKLTVTVTKGTGISSVSGAGTYYYGDSVSISASLSTGYQWVNWTGESTQTSQTYTFTMPDKDVSYTANASAINYKITYDENGGSSVTDLTYKITTNVTLAGAPTRAGYTFTGWKLATATGNWSATTYSASQNIGTGKYGNITLVAQWSLNSYTITYNLDGGSLPSGKTNPTSYNVTTETFPLNNPTKTGHTFLGWTGSNGTTAQTSVSVVKGSTGNKTFTANWKVNSYTATFDANGGTTANPQTITKNYGEALGTLPTTSRTGYTFDGWYTAASGGTKISSSTTMPASNVTYYAHWTANTYTLSYNANGGSGAPASQKWTYGGTNITVSTTVPTRTGYTFLGWAQSSTATTKEFSGGDTISSTKWASDKTLYAVWQLNNYTITYNLDGGYLPSGKTNPTSYNVTTTTFTLNNPVKTGYDFLGWTGSNGTTPQTSVSVAKGSTGNKSFTANWKAKEVTLTLDAKGGTGGTPSVKATYGKDLPSITIPTKAGYTFGGYFADNRTTALTSSVSKWTSTARVDFKKAENGWGLTTDSDKGRHFTAVITVVDSSLTKAPAIQFNDKTLTGATYKVEAVTNGWKYTVDFEITEAMVTAVGSTPYDTNYRFIDFEGTTTSSTVTVSSATLGGKMYYDASGKGVLISDFVEDDTLYARWTPITYTISYDLKGGALPSGKTNPTSYTIESGNIVLNNPTRTGYTFTGWTGSNGTTPQTSVTVPTGSTGNKSFTANWKANEFTVTYKANGGSGADVVQNIAHGSNTSWTTKPANTFSRTGYTFTGWNTKADGSGMAFAANTAQTTFSNLTLYAQWTGNQYTLSYDANGGTGAPASQKWTYGGTDITLSTTKPTKAGYKFVGWAQSSTATTSEFAAGETISSTKWASDKTLYAVWAEDGATYVVRHYQMNTSGGYPSTPTAIDELTGKTGTVLTLAKLAKTYTGFTYKEGKVGGTVVTTTTILADGSRVIDLYYTRNQYTVTLNKGTGIASVTQSGSGTYYYGVNVTINATASNGYKFDSWSGTHNTSTKEYTFTITGNVTDTANASVITYTITYNLDGGSLPSGKTNPTSYNVTTETFTLNNPTKTGYAFAGWTGTGISGATSTVKVEQGSTGNRSYTATWTPNTYTVTYKANGGSGADVVQNVTHGSNTSWTTKPSNTFTRTGYTFTGWNTKADGTGTAYAANTAQTTFANLTLYAQWTAADVNYTVNHYQMNTSGTYPSSPTATETLKAKADSTVTLANLKKTYTGFTYKEGKVGGAVVTTTKVNADGSTVINLYYTRNQHTVTLNKDTGIASVTGAGTYYYGENVTINATVSNGYKFDNWSGTHNTATKEYTFTITGNVTDTANASPITYGISYNLNGGALPSGKTNPTSYTIETPDFTLNNPTKEGYTFAGWTGTDISGADTSVTVEQGSTGTRSYTATWTPITYKVTYDLAGGSLPSGKTNPATYTIETPDFTLNNPTRTGFTFAGWTGTDISGADISVTVEQGSTGDRSYKATWTANAYTVIYKANGGTGADVTQSVTHGTNTSWTTKPADTFTREGWTFTGWNTKADGSGMAFAANTAQTTFSNLTLYAQWAPDTYTVTYKANGGTGSDVVQTVIHGDNESWTTKPANTFSRAGYEFLGWNTKADGSGTAYAANTAQTTFGNLTLYAQWKATGVVYTVNHYQMDTSGKYPASPFETEELSAVTGSIITLADLKNTYTGFTYKEGKVGGTVVTTTQINADGSTVINLYYTRNQHTVTLNKDTGIASVTGAGTYYYGEKVTINATVSNGYKFDNWSGTHNTATKEYTFTITGNVTDTANASPITYGISYNLNGGSLPSGKTNPTSYTIETPDFTLNNPTKEGYTFAGWTGTGISGADTSVTVEQGSTGTRSYTATWTPITYKVTYDLAGGSLPSGKTNPATYTIETPDFTLNNPTRTGFTFAGWTGTDISGADISVTVEQGSTGDRSYKATWTANAYTVIYKANGGTGADVTQSVTHGTNTSWTTKPANTFTREGWTFTGWNTKADGSGMAFAANTAQTTFSNLTLYAQWKADTYTVTYKANGGSGADVVQNVTHGDNESWTTKPADTFLRAGYEFLGWNTKADGSGTAYAANTAQTTFGNLTLYAQWKAVTYTISYNLNGGALPSGKTNPTSYTIETPTFTLVNPEKEGYIFAGWTGTGISGADTSVSVEKGSTGTRSYTATWTPVTYTISYDLDGGTLPSGKTNPTSYTIETPTFTLNNPEKEGYTFAGWTGTGISGADTSVSVEKGSTGDRSYKATWTINQYTASFDANGGTTPNPETITKDYNTAIGELPTTEKTGYEFDGWFTDKVGGTEITEDTLLTKDVTYYAHWTPVTYKVTYDLAGGSLPVGKKNPTSYTIETETFALNNPTKTGYTFAGWTGTGLDGATLNVSIEKGSTGDRSYKATWTPNTYIVKYDKNHVDATGTTADSTHTYDVESQLSPNGFEREGYRFIGWTANKDGSGIVYEDKAMVLNLAESGTVTLYAQWKLLAHTVTFDYATNGGTSVDEETVDVVGGDPVDLTNEAYKDGWTFIGWNTDKNATEGLDDFTMPDEDVTLYAIFAKDITVTFIDMKVDAPATRTETKTIFNNETEANFTVPAQHGFVGWTPVGWTTKTDAGEDVVEYTAGDVVKTSNDVTLYGCYEKDVTVHYDVNGSTDIITDEVKDAYYNASGDILNPEFIIKDGPTLEKNSFVEWELYDEDDNLIGTFQPGDTEEFGDDVTLVAKWDAFPEVKAPDRYFTLEEATNGEITIEKLLEKVLGEDKEDGILENGTEVTVPYYQPEDFTGFVIDGSVTVTVKATDSFGNETIKTFTVFIVDAGLDASIERSYIRYMDDKFFKDGSDFVSVANGGLEDTSIWRTDASYSALLETVLNNQKVGAEVTKKTFFGTEYSFTKLNSGAWVTLKQTWKLGKADIDAMKAYVDTNGFANYLSDDAITNLYTQFSGCID